MKTRYSAALYAIIPSALILPLFLMAPQASASTIVLNSGSSVTYLDSGFTSQDFSAPFTAASFSAAQTGPHASVLSSVPYYVSSLLNGPGAVWIDTNSTAGTWSGDTALYAVKFTLPSNFTSASLNLYYAVDNILGDTNPGIYLNGTALPNSTALACSLCSTSYSQQNTYNDPNISSLLVAGTNWLYIDAVNQGRQGGLIFSANIAYAMTPEPSSALLLGIGVLGLALVARHRRQAAAFSLNQPAL